VQSQVMFNRVPKKIPGQVWKAFGAERKKIPEVWEALVQSQFRFNRVPEKVPQKAFWEALVQSVAAGSLTARMGNRNG